MRKIAILHNGGGWITNIGNAFLDYGTMAFIRQVYPDSEIYLTSVLNRWISFYIKKYSIRRRKISNTFNAQYHSKVDFVTQAGAFLGKQWISIHGDIFLKLKEKGIKLIICGGGMTDGAYDNDEEIEIARKWLKDIKPYVFISRDEKSFKNFKDIAEYSYNGIDCAFFINDFYKPITFYNSGDYIVLNFDKRPEPTIKELGIQENENIVRVHHSFWHNFPFFLYPKMKKYYYDYPNTMISELPEDYLNIYANAKATYSDRVHACVVSLAYGTPARLFSNTPRSLLMERINAKYITQKLTRPNTKKIEAEKRKQIKFLSEII